MLHIPVLWQWCALAPPQFRIATEERNIFGLINTCAVESFAENAASALLTFIIHVNIIRNTLCVLNKVNNYICTTHVTELATGKNVDPINSCTRITNPPQKVSFISASRGTVTLPRLFDCGTCFCFGTYSSRDSFGV